MKKQLHPLEIDDSRAEELGKCVADPKYFVHNYCMIYDSVLKAWIPFRLWKQQAELLDRIHDNQQIVILKARQLGISWLCLGYALWQMMFEPIAAVAIFSRRETEAIHLMGEDRMRGMFSHLPPWMRTGHGPLVNSTKEWKMENSSTARAFPTSAGDGYVSTFAIVDEADLAPDLNKLMGSVKPTIDNGGKLVLLSRSNKEQPESEFKNLYRDARDGKNSWHPIFLPWHVHPGRDAEWYARQRRDSISQNGSIDSLYEQYPETDEQALSAKVLDKRIPPIWIEYCYRELPPITRRDIPAIPGLEVFIAPKPGAKYVLGADPAEGNPNSDDSALTVVDIETGEEHAVLTGKYEPAIFANYVQQVSVYYNLAPALVERNNHGHSVIQWLEEHARHVRLLLGHDADSHKRDKKTNRRRKTLKKGWLSSTTGKTILYTICAEHFRDNADVDNGFAKAIPVLHSRKTMSQLNDIEAASLSAPRGRHDDRADSYALAQAGRKQVRALGHTAGLVMETAKGWGM